MTPRFNPEVNGYWMCDIGRFDYHWIEGDERLQQPMVRNESGALDPPSWSQALAALADRVTESGGPAALRFLISAHASLEELAVLGRFGGAVGLPEHAVALTWRTREKPQPPDTKFKVPPVDAPNVTGARDLGFPVNAGKDGAADLTALQQGVEAGRVKVLYVFDPGPAGSIGDVSWLLAARQSGKLPLLVYQGVLLTDVAKAADIVLSGASWIEKDASYVNMDGRLQAAARAMAPPGDAQEDWKIFVGRRPRPRRRGDVSVERRRPRGDRFRNGRQRPVRGVDDADLRAACVCADVAASLEPHGTLEVGLHVPGPAAREVRGPSWPLVAAERDPAEGEMTGGARARTIR